MRAGLTKAAIEAYANALSREGINDAAARLKRLLGLFYGFATGPLTELLATLNRLPPGPETSSESPGQDAVRAVITHLRNLELVMEKVSTRGRLNDVIAFRKQLEPHESLNIEQFVKAVQSLRRGEGDGERVQPDAYKALADKLKAALGRDDQFEPLFKELEGLDPDGVARVAYFLMSAGSSKSRRKDLARIRERHESQRTLLAKQRAMAGRSAA